jgi:plastocyanin
MPTHRRQRHHRSGRAALVAVAAVSCGGLGACADDGPPAGQAVAVQAAALEPNGETAQVVSIDNTFRPETIEITAGTEVVWVNRGRNAHDILSYFGWGVGEDDFQPGDEYRHVFLEPGEFPYYCTLHGTAEHGMIGTVVVTDA